MSDTQRQTPADHDKAKLIAEVVILQSRGKAIKELIDQRKARLLTLMNHDGDLKRKTTEGSATKGERRKFVIHDRARLRELFSEDVLAEQIKVDAAFYDAAIKAKVAIDEAVTVEPDESFKVEGTRSAEERERRDRIMDETRLEMERRIEHLAARMMRDNAAAAARTA